ncbi:protein YgfX [Massilia sp. GCM10020059]|uniref:Uncharacterized protein n=1 Tax=Massilia agrisoli TaxID=2892444 RepID=A0ABS8IVN0_9BURK|nr:protein YgfX [Massilia agrisoli]MCC6071921.1 hypothetical protein [Massilia agrisoli]
MSIAITAVVKPSRLLRGALATYAAANLAVAVAMLSAAPGAFRVPWLMAAACLVAAVGAMAGLATVGNKRRIDISGVGEMRVTVQQKLSRAGMQNMPCKLLPGSAVWPGLLMLLVRGEDGTVAVVAILADSVSAEEFRAIAVAIRAIGGQEAPDQVFFGPHKIL